MSTTSTDRIPFRLRRIATWTAAVVGLSLAGLACEPQQENVASGPEEVNYWEQRKGQCDTVLYSPFAYKTEDLTRCMKLWETYRSVGDLSVSVRSKYAIAFSQVWYDAADEYDRAIADAALNRLCIKRHPKGGDGRVVEEVPDALQCGVTSVAELDQGASSGQGGTDVDAAMAANSEANELAELRGSVNVDNPSEKRRKKAASFNKKGLRAHNKKQFGKAIDFYEKALNTYPHYVTAKYNYVCALALLGDDEGAIANLEDLYSWDDPQVNQRLLKARTDQDLLTLRDYPRFKQLTGYFRLTLANGAGEFGLPHVERILGELNARRYPIAATVNDKNPRLNPIIFYRPGFEPYAEEFKVLLNARKVDMVPIDWQTLDDMIIIWGQQEAAGLYADDVQAAPIVQGTRAEEDKDGIGELTGAVKDAQGGAEDLKGTGEGVADTVPD